MSLTATLATAPIPKDSILIGGTNAPEPDKDEIAGTAEHPPASFPNYLPVWEVPPAQHPPLEQFDHVERGRGADATFPDLLDPGSKLEDITGVLGAEISGVQLSTLSDKGKDQLALLAATKKCFATKTLPPFPFNKQWTTVVILGDPSCTRTPGLLRVILRFTSSIARREVRWGQSTFPSITNSMAWHTDHSFEVQPPGVAFLYSLEVPQAGGDTVFVDMETAYERLSPAFRELLNGLSVVHTARKQAARAVATGGYIRRAPIDTAHPLVRTHPATGNKALYFNPSNADRVVGFKKEESDCLVKFLSDHIMLGHDMQCRVKWANGTVVVWDNRNTCHSALTDWTSGQRRHLARIVPAAERPYNK